MKRGVWRAEGRGKRGVRRGSEEEGGRREDEMEMRRKRRENKVKVGGRGEDTRGKSEVEWKEEGEE